MLVIHGDADETVPVALSRDFAAALPSLVSLSITPGAGHVESANVDPAGYVRVVQRWLRSQGIGAIQH
jgi:fermentation-respiration switch protein FrsA (DUF1100 family)